MQIIGPEEEDEDDGYSINEVRTFSLNALLTAYLTVYSRISQNWVCELMKS